MFKRNNPTVLQMKVGKATFNKISFTNKANRSNGKVEDKKKDFLPTEVAASKI